MAKEYGRIDYKPRSGLWVVVEYHGRSDITTGAYATREEAVAALQQYVTQTVRNRRNRLHLQGINS